MDEARNKRDAPLAGVDVWGLMGACLGMGVASKVALSLFASKTNILAVGCVRCRGAGELEAPEGLEPLMFYDVAAYLEEHGTHGAVALVCKSDDASGRVTRGNLSARAAEIITRTLHGLRLGLGAVALEELAGASSPIAAAVSRPAALPLAGRRARR